ncbi:hypothetical protein [Hoyosella subflava]|uniref:Uncharacterized protein n=1 Tax=Hoyosella subflava (strain DSM 45089 / JCM 17490 / NBRC 109087 / DQS3-9A1) TaxID=443218 RepID=F6EG00_HOYSD|nr:hypothetical protein [Hoyosella subflava]AEF38702.1 hypothetical protein AS9A_0242 [Hoyosella subflava DQS3-9A1]
MTQLTTELNPTLSVDRKTVLAGAVVEHQLKGRSARLVLDL